MHLEEKIALIKGVLSCRSSTDADCCVFTNTCIPTIVYLLIFWCNPVFFPCFPELLFVHSESAMQLYNQLLASGATVSDSTSPVTAGEDMEVLGGVGDCPSTENRQSGPVSFFTITSGPVRVTGLQIPSSSSWACCLLKATWRGGKKTPDKRTVWNKTNSFLRIYRLCICLLQKNN